jgi:LuxR family maltose regulon positive regulatory protein
MARPFAATKLYAPKMREGLTKRPRLSERLRRGTQSKLTLISAPAGFGKTTLLAEWLADSDDKRAVAWLSLDQTDNELTTFWSHLVAALRAATGAVGEAFPDLLPAGLAPNDAFLAMLVNALGDHPTTSTWCSTTSMSSISPTLKRG